MSSSSDTISLPSCTYDSHRQLGLPYVCPHLRAVTQRHERQLRKYKYILVVATIVMLGLVLCSTCN